MACGGAPRAWSIYFDQLSFSSSMVQPVTPISSSIKEPSNAPLAHLPFDMPLPDDIIEDVEPRGPMEMELPNLATEPERMRQLLQRMHATWVRRCRELFDQLDDIEDLLQLEWEEQVRANLRRANSARRALAVALDMERVRGNNLLTEVIEVEDEEVMEDVEDVESVEDISDGVEDVESTEEIE